MIAIKKIHKKDVPALMADANFWGHDFLSISKHRLRAHYTNPNCSDDDVILLLAYFNEELVGYMGVFIDKIVLDGDENKIGWLSTWWVHPKTQGTGIGREILNTMYAAQNGRIGISQFTPSAKRVYDKSGYFNTLKENYGIKAVLRSNLAFVLPAIFAPSKSFVLLIQLLDNVMNVFVGIKLALQERIIKSNLKDITIEYLSTIDPETEAMIATHNKNHISPKNAAFFEWLKAFHWVEEAPLLDLTNKDKYQFSIYDRHFNVYLIKILEGKKCIGFVVLQRRNHVCKILFAYYRPEKVGIVADIVKLQCIRQAVREIICYDQAIAAEFSHSAVFLYKTKKVKHSIISKEFGKDNFEGIVMNFGDGDCSFA
jgi:GNAT superfamily N-acetyltransferase